ncbi:hypothetical protein TSUD_374910 [Trifolium subterraneum]|uniref:Uncharacterized protein n=1 Tax=Trifolium subterraneum TaxID=3900 RepID=A0A2Z6NDU1_TRISU|nr:hypothetical protein TSUD_374910 [Trifolium subterraneum]
MSGAGKKPVVDTTIHVLDPSDSETTLLEKEIDEFELEPITSIKSEPFKAKKTPTPKKKVIETAVKAPRTKKKATLKKSKEKLLPTPLILPEDEEVFDQYWKTKPVAPSRMYNFGELSQGGVDLVKYVYPDRDLLTSNIKDVELVVDPFVIGDLIGIKSEGLEVYGNDWYDKVNVNKEDLKKEMFIEEGAKLSKPPSSMLKKEFKLLHNMCYHSFFPRTGIFEKTNLNVLVDASGDRLENALQTDGNVQISGDVNPTTENEKLVTTAAATLQGFNHITAPPNTTMPAKRSRLETDMEQIKKDLDNVIKGMTVQHSMMNHLILESKNLRDWFANVVCPQLHINPPPEITTPHFDLFPAQNNNSDDDDCPATSPAPDGANE